uniref:Uncharacterized protein n=1 Tax=Heterorhabditis bacteriophora TaxID=37862 RepID=A0A1I7WLA9_HETBA
MHALLVLTANHEMAQFDFGLAAHHSMDAENTSDMALIYANAVNKRMNNPIAKSKKKNTQSCPFRDESPSDLRENRRRSSSREKTPIRKVTVVKKYNLEHKYEKKNIETGKDGERRRSISLNPDQWTYQLAVGNDRNKEKDGAFQKMKRKFSKWKLSGRFE